MVCPYAYVVDYDKLDQKLLNTVERCNHSNYAPDISNRDKFVQTIFLASSKPNIKEYTDIPDFFRGLFKISSVNNI